MEKILTNKKKIIFWGIAILLVGIFTIFIFLGSKKIIWPKSPLIETASSTPVVKTFQYLTVVSGCDWAGVGACVNMRSGPGTKYPIIERLRIGVVLMVGDSVEVDGLTWYKVVFNTWLRYPERVEGDLYVAATDSVELFRNVGDQEVSRVNASSTKRILVDSSEEMLYAYEGDTLFMQESISTGLDDSPTPHGTFFVFKKTPSRYMQGPIPGISDQYYDLPGVPWDLYFTQQGAVIHGAYWHNNFGQSWSHGCVNLPVDKARKLYEWADVGIPVVIQY